MGRQYDKQHAITVVAAGIIASHRFVCFAGEYAGGFAGPAGVDDSAGVSEHEAAIGEAVSVITGYSATMEAGEAIAAGAFVKPGDFGVAVTGSVADHCGRALEAAANAGDLIEVQVLPHVHPAA